MESCVIGLSRLQIPIIAHNFGTKGPRVLILAGVHGDETEGVYAALGLFNKWQKKFPFKLQLTLIPMFNVDGVLRKERSNFSRVDLNRNLPTKDWQAAEVLDRYFPGPNPNSEPESQALVKWLNKNKPQMIISLHSWNPCLNVNGKCLDEAKAIHQITHYEITESIGYPTPGCLGTYAGLERDWPTLTYEIERGQEPHEVLALHIPAIEKALKVTEKLQVTKKKHGRKKCRTR